MSIVTVERKVLEKNDKIAAQNRSLFKEHGLFVLNLVSSPGSGKTSVLEQTIAGLAQRLPVAVIEGDVQTDLDAQRIAELNVPVAQIVTNGGCHLDAKLVQEAFRMLDHTDARLLLIENVGNLVCPANYDLGEHLKVVIVSTTEGDDKPLKYPGMFQKASILIINKIDLVPYVDSNPDVLEKNARTINPDLKVFRTSCTTNEGFGQWIQWLEEQTAGVPA